jgi:hypothetical protein
LYLVMSDKCPVDHWLNCISKDTFDLGDICVVSLDPWHDSDNRLQRHGVISWDRADSLQQG